MTSSTRTRLTGFIAAFPRGGGLPESAWRARHQGIIALLWVHVAALVAVGAAIGEPLAAYVLAPGLVAVFTVAANWERLSHAVRASMATSGLLASSAILIAYFDGLIEAHFHFFFAVAVVSLYQSWRPYLLAVGFVLAHHLAFGTLVPDYVYNHAAAMNHPWWFALVHGGAVLAESLACLVFWKVTEDALDAARANQEQLERANAELTRANVAVADLVAMLSHDLRVPLAVLIGYSEMALESWAHMTTAEQIDFVGKVHRAGHALHAMLEDTLTISVLDGDGLDPRPVPVRVDEAVREAVAALPEPTPDVDLTGLSPATAMIDPVHVAQVLTNLLTNAVKYGGGRFAVSTDAGDEQVLVSISDSGPGVPASFVPQLFDRFSRSDEARVGSKNGTGLGLYITHNLLEANGGTITYQPTPGGGATFCLRLPSAARTSDLLSR